MIVISGDAEEAFQKNLPPAGQFVFLPKLFTLKQVVATVNETVAGCDPWVTVHCGATET